MAAAAPALAATGASLHGSLPPLAGSLSSPPLLSSLSSLSSLSPLSALNDRPGHTSRRGSGSRRRAAHATRTGRVVAAELRSTGEEFGDPRRNRDSVGSGRRTMETAAVAGTEAPSVSDLSKLIGKKQKFVWESQWYPIGLVQDFDEKIPEPVTILGRPMVVWFDPAGGDWRVFHDLCPHRLAPLSEGRIHESGALQCSYHGWTFKGDGACTSIPQAPSDGPPVHTSPKACARVYPSRVQHGMLFVWPDSSKQGAALADATPIHGVPELDDPSLYVSMGQGDLNYGYEFLVENLADPAHVPFAHHGIMGNREDGAPLDFAVNEINLNGFSGGGVRFRRVNFYPPCLVLTEIVVAAKPQQEGIGNSSSPASDSKPGKDKKITMCFYCIPRSPGKSRVVFAFAFNFLPKVAQAVPRWYTHLGQMMVLDSDHYFLHLLEKRLEDEGGNKKALEAYYAPTKSDAFVLAFRRWFNEYADATVGWPAGVDRRLPAAMDKRTLLDRQLNHVRMCKSCKKAQGWFEKIQVALQVASFASLALAVLRTVLRPAQASPVATILAVSLSAVFAIGAKLLSKFVNKYYHFHDYIHALVK